MAGIFVFIRCFLGERVWTPPPFRQSGMRIPYKSTCRHASTHTYTLELGQVAVYRSGGEARIPSLQPHHLAPVPLEGEQL